MLTTTFCLLSLLATHVEHPRPDAVAATAETRYASVRGNRIAYRRIGAGSPILLANRMRGTLDTWDPLFLDELAREHSVITFDYPGVGYSSGTLPPDIGEVAGIVKQLAAELDIARCAVLGWSWGGYVTQALLLDAPDLVTHAVLVGTNPPGEDQVPVSEVWKERAFKPINNLADEEILFFEPASEASRAAARSSHARIYARPDVVSKIPSRMEEFEVFFRAHEVYRADALGRRLALQRTRTPILVLCGDNDISVPVENWYPIIGDMPQGQLLVLPESGHGPQHQYPELSAAYVSEFLRHAKPDASR